MGQAGEGRELSLQVCRDPWGLASRGLGEEEAWARKRMTESVRGLTLGPTPALLMEAGGGRAQAALSGTSHTPPLVSRKTCPAYLFRPSVSSSVTHGVSSISRQF